MAIKRSSKIQSSFAASSMTDLMFLLLLFLLIATTLINPNALRLSLPQGTNKLKDKAHTSVSIQAVEGGSYKYYVELEPVNGVAGVEEALKIRFRGINDTTISLHCDKEVPINEVVKVMSVATQNNYKMILATSPN